MITLAIFMIELVRSTSNLLVVVLTLLFFSHLVLKHFFKLATGLWIRHFNLSYMFAQRYSAAPLDRSIQSSCLLLHKNFMLQKFCILFLLWLETFFHAVQSVNLILFQTSFLHSLKVADLLQREILRFELIGVDFFIVFSLSQQIVFLVHWSQC